MNIGFDAKRAFMNHSGLGQYSRNLLLGLMHAFPENQYTLFTPKQKIHFLNNTTSVRIVTPVHFIDRNFPSWWRYARIIKEPAFNDIQVFHGLSAELPQGIESTKVKKVVTIHDLIYERYPQYYPTLDRYFYRKKTKHACTVADIIICASNQTKEDLVDMYDVTESKIRVIYQSLSDIQKPMATTSPAGQKPFLVYVSSFNPRKNHLRLIQAFAKSNLGQAYNLVFIGQHNSYVDALHREITRLNIKKSIQFKHHCTDAEVQSYLRQAAGMLYPSEYEGFGIPILEGYFAGVPVLTSNCSSMLEVAQDACVLVDPFQTEDIARGLSILVNDTIGNEARVQRGKKLLQEKFSLQQFVEMTYQSYL